MLCDSCISSTHVGHRISALSALHKKVASGAPGAFRSAIPILKKHLSLAPNLGTQDSQGGSRRARWVCCSAQRFPPYKSTHEGPSTSEGRWRPTRQVPSAQRFVCEAHPSWAQNMIRDVQRGGGVQYAGCAPLGISCLRRTHLVQDPRCATVCDS